MDFSPGGLAMELADLAQVRFVCHTKILLKCGLPNTRYHQTKDEKLMIILI